MLRLPRVKLPTVAFQLAAVFLQGLGRKVAAQQPLAPLVARLGKELVVEGRGVDAKAPGLVEYHVCLGQELNQLELVERRQLGEGCLVDQGAQVDLAEDGLGGLEVDAALLGLLDHLGAGELLVSVLAVDPQLPVVEPRDGAQHLLHRLGLLVQFARKRPEGDLDLARGKGRPSRCGALR